MSLAPLIGRAADAPTRDDADVIVWDSTPAGLTAAVAAARAGLSVIIVTEDKHLGGLQTSGLGNTNAGQVPTIGGITREFHARVLKYYTDKYGPGSAQVKDGLGGYRHEPHVAEAIWEDWLRESKVTCARELVIETVEKVGPRIVALRTTGGRRFTGRVFIDASYEGDLLALAKCAFHLGREARDTYGESLAGVTYPPDQAGRGDRKLQPFDYRCCLTDNPANRVPFTEPEGYDPAAYGWLASKIRPTAKSLTAAIPINRLPNAKTDSRMAEWPGKSWDYIDAHRPRRAAIDRAHRLHSAGYLWFCQTHPSVPQPIREEVARWGLAKDEFTDNGNWPWHVYVREGRRLVGEFVMTEKDCVTDRFKADSVGVCSWYLDVHPVEVTKVGDKYHGDGEIHQAVQPFDIPWRSLLPKAADADNLLVPVACSASHVAFSSIRVEPVWMILGQACGVAAAMCVSDSKPLHQLPVEKLRATLKEQGQVIDARPFTEFYPKRKG
ncbi:MAG: FAD-dependent oxidoreductase [Phycisphaerae bacterium]|nr:FAD-dependent oxidoreductase [Tepidisphaeraceae bacterium]